MNALDSRPHFVAFYKTTRNILGPLVEELNEQSVLEYVSSEGVLTIPLKSQELEKPLPILEIKLTNEVLRISLTYKDADEIRHLKNLLHPSQLESKNAFTETMKLLPVSFETRLYMRDFKGTDYTFVKKYIASRIDASILGLLLDEAEMMRSGGRRVVDGRSVYEAPATPLLYLLYRDVNNGDEELRTVISQMRPVIALVVGVKTQREIIHSRISKPVEQANHYRVVSQLLNKARNQGYLSAVERRDLEKKWREVPEERNAIEEELRRRLGEST
jgi:hypothetical protein